jgi:CHRD domain
MSENRTNENLTEDFVTISSTLDGEQEVEAGDADASGISTLTLNETGDGLEYSLTVTGIDFGASGLIEGGPVTEETSDDLTRIHIHNAPRGENGDVVFSLFDSLAEDDAEIPGNQDEDLTFTPNDDGSVTLTGVWEGTDASSTPLSAFVDEMRATEAGEDLDLYWNVHTEEFPDGAIRGQLVVEETAPEPETIELYRFRNTSFDSGTYVFVGAEERDGILADPNLNQTFSLDGEQEDGTVNPAFVASTVTGEDYIPFYRIKSLDVAGTFLFVSTEEYEGIFAEDSEQRDKWEQEGFDEAGEDIPEFYLYDGSADLGTEFNRFQNNQNNTFLYAGPEETEAIANDPNLSNVFNNQGVAFESLG